MTVTPSNCPRCHRELLVIDCDDAENITVDHTTLDPAQLDTTTTAALIIADINVWIIWTTRTTTNAALIHPWLRRHINGTHHIAHNCATPMPGQHFTLTRAQHQAPDTCPF